MKKHIAFLLLTAMLASLAACGGTDTPAAETTAGDTTEKETGNIDVSDDDPDGDKYGDFIPF